LIPAVCQTKVYSVETHNNDGGNTLMIETLPAGTVLRGRYRIERILGSGGFGHVYLAVDAQSSQQYAVKEYLVTGAGGKAQLEHEARVLSQLHHPSLPAFQDAFDERGRYYIVLGYIEGSDLTDCLRMVRQKNEAVSIERILTWMISICDAVSFLHNQQPTVIHRDIKPDNIRITPDGTAILVDLGNAKAIADGARTLFFIRHQGTPGYAPLEQYPGGPGTDARSDVYALGGTLYFALTAHEPPSVSTRHTSKSQGSSDLPTLQEILAQNPPETPDGPSAGKQFRLGVTKPSKPAPRHSRHVAQLGALSPEQLNRLNSIIQRAMAMRPEERYPSVAQMSSDLRAVLDGLHTPAQPPAHAQDRPYDPHSTQPDLPFLFESMQSAPGNQGNTPQVIQDAPKPPPAPSPAPTSQAAVLRCPNCQTELPQKATFCPKCGASLSDHAPRNSQSQKSAIASSPGSPAQAASKATDPKNKTLKGTTSEPAMFYNPAQPQTAQRPMQSQSTAPRPFLQTAAPASRRASETKPAQPPPALRPVPTKPAAPPTPAASPAAAPGGVMPRKLLFYVIAAFVILLLVLLFLLVSHLGEHTATTPFYTAQQFSMQTKGLIDERNLAFCAAAPAAHPGAGIRPRGACLPAAAGIA
jgi:serine/threonine protein kinase